MCSINQIIGIIVFTFPKNENLFEHFFCVKLNAPRLTQNQGVVLCHTQKHFLPDWEWNYSDSKLEENFNVLAWQHF